MEPSLIMRTEASHVLNFLIYIQNIYLNQNRRDAYKFPYYSSEIRFTEDFEKKFSHLWVDMLHRVSDHKSNGTKVFYEENDLFYKCLFEQSSDSLEEYSEIHKSFQAWWGSFAGHFAVERSIDEKSAKLYRELTDVLSQKGFDAKIEWNVSLIYDECVLSNVMCSSYFAVMPIGDFFVNHKELVPKIQKCMD